MLCQFLVDGSYCKGFLGGEKVPNADELKAYCNGDFKACPTYQKKAEYDPRSIKKEGKMPEMKKVYRVLYQDESKVWKIKKFSNKRRLDNWMIGHHPDAQLIRFAAVPDGGTKQICDTMEDALEFAAKHGNCQVQPVVKGADLPHNVIERVYKLLPREVN